MSTFLSNLDWRFATKSFDPEKKLSQEQVDKVLEAILQTPSSFGLQPFQVIDIKDTGLRDRIKPIAFGQPQVTDASNLLVFCARKDMASRIDEMISLMGGGEKLAGFKDMMHGHVASKSQEAVTEWSARQSYIALGFALAACAELQIDSCAMEGFDPVALHKELGLADNLVPVLMLPIGYRLEGPKGPKFRFSKEDLFSTK